ncbi:MAG TPA: hypothetical protein PLG56_01660, partial [Lacunisphaera sp.]|nr:hypothetical protein [Lacunisphaera sp.]
LDGHAEGSREAHEGRQRPGGAVKHGGVSSLLTTREGPRAGPPAPPAAYARGKTKLAAQQAVRPLVVY